VSGWNDDFELLPDTTSDERDDGRDEDDDSNDDRLLNERPPHWN
jgi:hypothetical protein